MSEATAETEFVLQENRRLCAFYTFTDSIKILFKNLKLFIFISILTIFPLSLLVFSSVLYCEPLKAQINHLDSIAWISPRFEAIEIRKQVRDDSITLLWLKVLFWVPCYALSLIATMTVVNSTALACAGKRPNLLTALTAARLTWKRSMVTSIYVFVIMVVYIQLTRVVTVSLGSYARARSAMAVLGAVLEVELMAVLGFGMVVSVLEERFGWEAVKVGWGLMEGRRFCSWVLSGFLLLVSGGVGWRLRVSMDGQDSKMVLMVGLVDHAGLICLFGLIVLLSYVIFTVFYCECRTTRRLSKSDSESSRV